MSASRQSRIAELNDQLRASAGLPAARCAGSPKGITLLTVGIGALQFPIQLAIVARVRSFTDFTADNDPHSEHDFGSFDLLGVGKIFWKIDVYSGESCDFGAEDPSDPENSFRVLTIMLAEEY